MTETHIIVLTAITVLAFAFAFVNCLWRHGKTRKVTSFWLAVAMGVFFFTIPALISLLLGLGITGYIADEYYSLCRVAGAAFLLIAAWLYRKNRAGKNHAKHIH